jgi:hypothetical protein
MSDRVWARVGQFGTLLAAITAVITCIILLRSPSTLLVADIYPMGFELPLPYKDIEDQVKPGTARDTLMALGGEFSEARGLVKINLHNTGELQITDIRVKVDDAVLYAKSFGKLSDAQVIPSDDGGIKLGDMRQGDFITLYAWTKTPIELYQYWIGLHDKFQITFPQGIATKNVYIEDNLFEGWMERNFGYFFFVLGLTVAVVPSVFLLAREMRSRRPRNSTSANGSDVRADS